MRTRTACGLAAWTASQPRPELVEHVRREVLDDDVDLLDEAAGPAPAPLGDVRSRTRSRLLGLTARKNGLRSHHDGSVAERQADHADAVHAGGRLDVDHVGAERRQEAPSPPVRPTSW